MFEFINKSVFRFTRESLFIMIQYIVINVAIFLCTVYKFLEVHHKTFLLTHKIIDIFKIKKVLYDSFRDLSL